MARLRLLDATLLDTTRNGRPSEGPPYRSRLPIAV